MTEWSALKHGTSNDSGGNSTLDSISLGGVVTPLAVSLGQGFTGGLAYSPGSGLFYAISSDSLGNSSLSDFTLASSWPTSLFSVSVGTTTQLAWPARYQWFWSRQPCSSCRPNRGCLRFFTNVPAQRLRNAQSHNPEGGSERAISIGQALYAYTQASAFAEHRETKKGKLVRGQFGDFVVLDRDLLTVQPAEILKTKVLRTVVGGETVFHRCENSGRSTSRTPA